MAMLKQCSRTGCTKIIDDGVKYCKYHQKKYDVESKERYKEYKERRLQDKQQKKYQQFYSSKSWQRIRQAVINTTFNIDILEYYVTGRIVEGETVHHIKELNEEWDCRLDVCNLIYLTQHNHLRVHKEYSKGEREKKKMQKILLSCIDRFQKEFRV